MTTHIPSDDHGLMIVYDSGKGALAVAQALQTVLPNQTIQTYSDSDYFPYGNKTKQQLHDRLRVVIDRLIVQIPELSVVVFACHTLSNMVLPELKDWYASRLQIIDIMRPTAQMLAADNHPKVFWLATSGSLSTLSLLQTAQSYGFSGQLIPVACDEWVTAIESGLTAPLKIKQIIMNTLTNHPIFHQNGSGVEPVFLLGCTHFHFWHRQLFECFKPCCILEPHAWLAKMLPDLLAPCPAFI